ncbi:RagB/SusD family nutrient uptake outer membrane protein [termite gut metagenome]|uniref:RagB/SusD family nutrient uptake outer membrane protein n=1 Tax=termite gut metagenome TaxID=433724 RepID=A0A5J4SQA1_9ZZZZ
MKKYSTGSMPKKNSGKRPLSLLSLVAVAIIAFSCADLELPSDGRLTMEDIFSNYQKTRNFYDRCGGWVPQVGFTYGDSPLASFCDEAHDASDNRSGVVNDWYNNRTSAFNNPLTGYINPWNHYFEGIRKCNTFLVSINDPALATYAFNEEEKSGWIADVHVLRAFYYLQLIKRYGGVPLKDVPDEVTADFSKDVRATFEQCVDFILADCDFALAVPEPANNTIGFRWYISDNDRGKVTRGFAHAVKSQAVLYAASPLWFTSGSKYTWEKAAEVTKEALDQCLLHGYELYNVPVAEDVAQNPYAYYFIQRSDPSRSVDKETIYETTALRTNVWRNAGTPITEGMSKAGAGPSQELVDSYEMKDGTQPVLGYSDADHLRPILNTTSLYDPAKPYEGRDPRFYASIYYNNSPRSLSSGVIEKEIYSLEFTSAPVNNTTFTDEGSGVVKLATTGGDPWIHTTSLGKPLASAEKSLITFEYKSNTTIANAEFFWCVDGGPVGGKSSGENIRIAQANDWTRFEYDLTAPINNLNFGAANHFFRFDLGSGAGYEISIRNFQVETFNPPPAPMPVETFVGGNCGISDRVTDVRFTRTGYYMRKFNNYKSNANVDADGLMKIFRLGELYLNFAEAAYQAYGADAPVPSTVGGSALSAREAVNAIRARVDMPPLPAMSSDDFEKRYRNERRVELAFEEHRFFDVRRWKILSETDLFVTGMKIVKSGDTYTYDRIKLKERGTNADKYLMYPIMQGEVAKMEESTGVTWQNPGWN